MKLRLLPIMVSVLVLHGCGKWDKEKAALLGGASKVCVDGVEYLQFTSGVTPSFSQDGKLKKCE